MRGTVACYPPVWRGEQTRGGDQAPTRADRLRTVMITEAVATMLGASALLYGDRRGVLCDPYYPNYEPLQAEEAAAALQWHRFALRQRDLFIDGEDTSWCDVGDENGAIAVAADAPVTPEPVGGAVFVRVVRSEHSVGVAALDLTGSQRGSWAEPTAPGRVGSLVVDALLPQGTEWRAEAASVGSRHGRFSPLAVRSAQSKQGLVVRVELDMTTGWSVALFRR